MTALILAQALSPWRFRHARYGRCARLALAHLWARWQLPLLLADVGARFEPAGREDVTIVEQAAGRVSGHGAYCFRRVRVSTEFRLTGCISADRRLQKWAPWHFAEDIDMGSVRKVCGPTLCDTCDVALRVLVMHHEKRHGCEGGCGAASSRVIWRSAWSASAADTLSCRQAWPEHAALCGSPLRDAVVDSDSPSTVSCTGYQSDRAQGQHGFGVLLGQGRRTRAGAAATPLLSVPQINGKKKKNVSL